MNAIQPIRGHGIFVQSYIIPANLCRVSSPCFTAIMSRNGMVPSSNLLPHLKKRETNHGKELKDFQGWNFKGISNQHLNIHLKHDKDISIFLQNELFAD